METSDRRSNNPTLVIPPSYSVPHATQISPPARRPCIPRRRSRQRQQLKHWILPWVALALTETRAQFGASVRAAMIPFASRTFRGTSSRLEPVPRLCTTSWRRFIGLSSTTTSRSRSACSSSVGSSPSDVDSNTNLESTTYNSHRSKLSSAVAGVPHPVRPVPDDIGAADWGVAWESPRELTTAVTVLGGGGCERVLDLQLPEGRCVGYAINMTSASTSDPQHLLQHPESALTLQALASPHHWLREYLHPQEISHGCNIPSDVGRTSFLLGRLALRNALRQVMGEDSLMQQHTVDALSHCILKDSYGRPKVPRGYLGSISHKRNIAVALAVAVDHATAMSRPLQGIGIDIECASAKRGSRVASKVLTPHERASLGRLRVRCCDGSGLCRCVPLGQSLHHS